MSSGRKKSGFVRIISGQWRGRKLPVADVQGLRPSGDRGREVLFNWLQGSMHGRRCADLFAGSGALGFEAASRGAGEVTLVERSRTAAEVLRRSAELLKADQVAVVGGDAIQWLRQQEPGCLDIVFIDPPFDSGLAEAALEVLVIGRCLAPDGLVYLEGSRLENLRIPAGWAVEREKVLGDVRMQLLKVANPV